jgi:hypothetical protein
MKLIFLGAVLSTAVLLAAQHASGQVDSAVSLTNVAAQQAGPGKSNGPVSPDSEVQFSTSQDTASASGKITFRTNLGLFDQTSIAASTPITSGATAVDFGSLDTMANGAALKLQLSGLSVTPNRPTDKQSFEALRKGIQDLCSRVWAIYDAENQLSPGSKQYKDASADCNWSDIAKLKNPLRLESNYERLMFVGPLYFWGVNGQAGYQQYSYFGKTSLNPELQRSTPWSLGAYFAYQPDVAANLIAAITYQHQFGYQPGTAKLKCPAGSVGGAGCVDGQIGPPGAKTKDLITFDLKMKPASYFAFDLQPSYDVRSGVWGPTGLFYFVGDGKNPLAGGLSVSWRSDKHVTTVGVFLSKPFGLAPPS